MAASDVKDKKRTGKTRNIDTHSDRLLMKLTIKELSPTSFAQSAEAVEYTDCTSAEG